MTRNVEAVLCTLFGEKTRRFEQSNARNVAQKGNCGDIFAQLPTPKDGVSFDLLLIRNTDLIEISCALSKVAWTHSSDNSITLMDTYHR